MDEVKGWAGVLATLLSIGSIVYTWLTATGRANGAKLDEHGAALVDHDRRIQAVEAELKHLPTKEDVAEVKLAISELNGRLGRIEESGQGTSRAVRRIEEYLLKERG
ncbi:hypothetical protein AWH62_00880 [Maricaulis sp. W15]|uniref:DUF2730 family protein n=1 Tax=Maricaulis sp. W15 TaxID=1772333 RepID=UPI000965C582|nr:DUF2730 family protein [Maricaulis sp. W15]OLF81261.1 hypothetical protein AWH62_00880 [Maricaulis sp. W15]